MDYTYMIDCAQNFPIFQYPVQWELHITIPEHVTQAHYHIMKLYMYRLPFHSASIYFKSATHTTLSVVLSGSHYHRRPVDFVGKPWELVILKGSVTMAIYTVHAPKVKVEG